MTLSSGIERPSAVFGSAGTWDLRPDSVVDILVDCEPDARMGLVKFASLSEELEGLVGAKWIW